MSDEKKPSAASPQKGHPEEIDRPRLTPQGRTDRSGQGRDGTAPKGGAKGGQPDKAEG